MALSHLSLGTPITTAFVRRLPRAVLVVAAVLTLVASGKTQADVIYDGFTEATGGAISTQFGAKYIALGFRTTAAAYRLSSIDMGLAVADSTIPDPDDPFGPPIVVPRSGSITFSIYGADPNTFPQAVGDLIQNISSSIPVSNFPDGSTPAPLYSLTGLNVTLSPDTQYYLVANYPNAPDSGNLFWYQGVIDNTNPAFDERWSDSADGTTWRFPQQNGTGPLKATINAVPEPATLGLAAIAGLSGLALRRGRRARAQARRARRRKSHRPAPAP